MVWSPTETHGIYIETFNKKKSKEGDPKSNRIAYCYIIHPRIYPHYYHYFWWNSHFRVCKWRIPQKRYISNGENDDGPSTREGSPAFHDVSGIKFILAASSPWKWGHYTLPPVMAIKIKVKRMINYWSLRAPCFQTNPLYASGVTARSLQPIQMTPVISPPLSHYIPLYHQVCCLNPYEYPIHIPLIPSLLMTYLHYPMKSLIVGEISP